MKYTVIHIFSFFIVACFFACSHSADTPADPVPANPGKPVSSLSMIIYQWNSGTPIIWDSSRLIYDSGTTHFSNCQYPFFNYGSLGSQVINTSAHPDDYTNGFSSNSYYEYAIKLDLNRRPLSGARVVSVYSNAVGNGASQTYTITTDSIDYSTSNGLLTQVVFRDRSVFSKRYVPLNDTLVVTKGILETYTFTYDAAGSVSKVHGDTKGNKWDIEYSYGSGKSPMTNPEKYLYMPDNLTIRAYYGGDYLMAMSLLQARHEITKIKITDLLTGQVAEISFSYTLQPDGYPDYATVKETGQVTLPKYLSRGPEYRLKFIYNY